MLGYTAKAVCKRKISECRPLLNIILLCRKLVGNDVAVADFNSGNSNSADDAAERIGRSA